MHTVCVCVCAAIPKVVYAQLLGDKTHMLVKTSLGMTSVVSLIAGNNTHTWPNAISLEVAVSRNTYTHYTHTEYTRTVYTHTVYTHSYVVQLSVISETVMIIPQSDFCSVDLSLGFPLLILERGKWESSATDRRLLGAESIIMDTRSSIVNATWKHDATSIVNLGAVCLQSNLHGKAESALTTQKSGGKMAKGEGKVGKAEGKSEARSQSFNAMGCSSVRYLSINNEKSTWKCFYHTEKWLENALVPSELSEEIEKCLSSVVCTDTHHVTIQIKPRENSRLPSLQDDVMNVSIFLSINQLEKFIRNKMMTEGVTNYNNIRLFQHLNNTLLPTKDEIIGQLVARLKQKQTLSLKYALT